MLTYLKYFVTWLFFMALIAGITLIVPKLAKKIDKWRAEKKAQMKQEQELLQPPEAESGEKSESTPENNNENNK